MSTPLAHPALLGLAVSMAVAVLPGCGEEPPSETVETAFQWRFEQPVCTGQTEYGTCAEPGLDEDCPCGTLSTEVREAADACDVGEQVVVVWQEYPDGKLEARTVECNVGALDVTLSRWKWTSFHVQTVEDLEEDLAAQEPPLTLDDLELDHHVYGERLARGEIVAEAILERTTVAYEP